MRKLENSVYISPGLMSLGVSQSHGTRSVEMKVEMWKCILENLFKIYVKAYKSFYGAAIFCLENGGFLAEQILDVEKALKFCKHLKGKIYFPNILVSSVLGSCTPSLIARKGRCYQWSPLDGLVINLKGHVNILIYEYLFYRRLSLNVTQRTSRQDLSANRVRETK